MVERSDMRRVIERALLSGLAVLTIAALMGRTIFAAFTVPVPEIDGNTAATGLGLVLAGVLILRANRNSRKH